MSVSWDLITLSRAPSLVSGLTKTHAAQPVGHTARDQEAGSLFGKWAASMDTKVFKSHPYNLGALEDVGTACLPEL